MLLELPSSNVEQNTRTVHYRNVKKVDIESFRKDLEESYETMNIYDDDNFQTMCTQYHNTSVSVVDKHSPILKIKCKTTQPPWIDEEYKKNRAIRRRYEKDWKKNRTEMNQSKYIDQKNLCAELALTKQNSHYSKVIQDAGNCQKSLFKIANELLDKSKQKVLPTYTDPRQLADEFNKFYVDKVKKIRSSIPEAAQNSSYSRPFKGKRMKEFRVLTEDDVGKIIKSKGILRHRWKILFLLN